MTTKLVLEVRANESATRTRNPHVPFTPEEIAADSLACREAGASIYHVHGRTPDGAPDLSAGTYRRVVAGIRARSDILIHPTLGGDQQQADTTARTEPIRRLVADGLAPDLVPLDMGSSNVDVLTDDLSDFATRDTVYVNSTRTLRHLAGTLRELGVTPALQFWNIQHMRLAEAFVRMGVLDEPLFATFILGGGTVPIGHPGTVAGLDAFLITMPDEIPIAWSTLLFGADLLDLAPTVIERGGHLALGIGDHPYTADGVPMTNAEVAARVVAMAAELGRGVATPDEARAILTATRRRVTRARDRPGR